MVKAPLLSLLVPSRRLHQLAGLLDSVRKTTRDAASIEVIVKVDDDMTDALAFLEKEKERHDFTIKYLSSPRLGGVFTLWVGIEEVYQLCHPDSYFVMVLTDEGRFETPNWDDLMRKYVGFHPDHIFRLRISVCQAVNYANHFTCMTKPESFAIYTHTWLRLTEGIGNFCYCSDAYHQCIAYHMGLGLRSYNDVWNEGSLFRDVQIHGMEFGGLDFAQDITGVEQRARDLKSYREWARLGTYQQQRHMTYLARRIYLYVWAIEHGVENFRIARREADKTVALIDTDSGAEQLCVSYRPPRFPVYLANIIRWTILIPHLYRRVGQELISSLKEGRISPNRRVIGPSLIGLLATTVLHLIRRASRLLVGVLRQIKRLLYLIFVRGPQMLRAGVRWLIMASKRMVLDGILLPLIRRCRSIKDAIRVTCRATIPANFHRAKNALNRVSWLKALLRPVYVPLFTVLRLLAPLGRLFRFFMGSLLRLEKLMVAGIKFPFRVAGSVFRTLNRAINLTLDAPMNLARATNRFFRKSNLPTIVDYLLSPIDRLTEVPPSGMEKYEGGSPISFAARFRATGYPIPDPVALRASYDKIMEFQKSERDLLFSAQRTDYGKNKTAVE